MSHPKHDVFLSFRGEDTRDNFTSHLHAELCRKKIETFIDNRLVRGEEISPALYRAIEESAIYVIILSEHYASSSWCLDELTEILKCKERYGREVIPVFYKVDPSNVRHQRQSYADDFVKHHQRFGGKVDAWKAALTQVAGLSGWDSQVTRPESTLVTEIVKDILKKLNSCFSSNYEGMTGIDMHIEQIQSLLLLELPTVRIIGIWGMGGIGKTTIVSAVFEKLATQFSSKSIILNVQQEIKRVGLDNVKSKYLSKLLGEDITSSENNYSFDPRLKRTKVLLVFDDVKDSDQLKDLIGTHSNFGQGSRIIVTSRDKQVLENANADEIYQVREMDYHDSLQLFCLFAFKQKNPKESFVSLTEKVLDYAKGLPLALKVLGSLLYGKANEVWESQLQKLEKIPDLKIFRLLKLSYDGLDDEQKDIFLDIACFHRGEDEKDVAITLDSCGFSANIGMDVLKDRCLISISHGSVWMHDLIQEMGHEIVRLQCVDDPGKRSRLWKASDFYDVLSKNMGKATDAIRCIFLNMDEIEKVQLDADTFKKMHHLRIINFYNCFGNYSNVTFHGLLKSFPNDLKFLHWDWFPQRSLPKDFCLKNLSTLEMPRSDLEQLWEGNQALPNLKRLNLSYSKKLTRLPDLSSCSNIEEVCLSGCISLTQVYSSTFLNNLYILSIEDCTELKSIDIPSNILSRPSGLVTLTDCHNLETLLISSRTDHVVQFTHSYRYYKFERMKSCCEETEIAMNDEGDYEIRESFSDTVTSINDFYWFDISKCESLTCLPAELLNLKFLRTLSLSGCLKLEELPEIKETMENLKVLVLDHTSIKELPSSLHRLVGLEELSLQSCKKLKTIPSSIGNFSKLLKLNLANCASLETFPSSIFKLKLTELDFNGCSMLRTFPEILEPAESFTCINLRKTAIKELPSSLDQLVGLEELILQSCRKLKNIPSSIGNLSKLLKLNLANCASLETFPSSIFILKLTELDFNGCSILRTFPEIPNDSVCLSSLTELSLQGSRIVNLHESVAHLSSLRSLNLSDCELLECVPKLPPNLNQVLAFDCPSVKRMMLNSRSDFQKSTFKFNLTNSEELDGTSLSKIEEEAYIKIKDDAYRSVLFCFPGSAIPYWFRHRCQGHSITIRSDDLYLYGGNKLIGFALCVVLGRDFPFDLSSSIAPWYNCIGFTYQLKFEPDHGQIHFHPNKFEGKYDWMPMRRFSQHHTFLWKYELDLATIGYGLIDADTITFEILDEHRCPLSFPTTMTVIECGICPLYAKENNDDSIEEPSGSGDAVCLVDLDLSLGGNYTHNKRRKT
ncbi:disease resistance protein RPV1-like isoform X1 [Trifolium pratense]|uniref:disease resistance protein RPV1-like isoform X1 n=1 Tax=Trifolium pratense TaxID=57577 RepID=UPI001E694692|nr:disease resistance protein RPV1-like isoform X1 [Trifolium pratense]